MVQNIISLDYSIESLLAGLYNPSLFGFFEFITEFGSIPVIIIIFVCIFYYLWRSGERSFAKRLVLFFGLNEVAVYLIKIFINRPRPFGAFALGETSGSFPSGHATASIFIYGFIIYYFSKNYLTGSKKKIVNALLVLLIVLIGFSRLYLNAHFFWDVVGGYLLGAAFLTLLLRSKN